jgi:hypothetical protein
VAIEDPQRLDLQRLIGEPDTSDNLEDVQHWRNVYAQLRSGFRDIADPSSGQDREALLAQLERVDRRFRFWDELCRDLMAMSVPLVETNDRPA